MQKKFSFGSPERAIQVDVTNDVTEIVTYRDYSVTFCRTAHCRCTAVKRRATAFRSTIPLASSVVRGFVFGGLS